MFINDKIFFPPLLKYLKRPNERSLRRRPKNSQFQSDCTCIVCSWCVHFRHVWLFISRPPPERWKHIVKKCKKKCSRNFESAPGCVPVCESVSVSLPIHSLWGPNNYSLENTENRRNKGEQEGLVALWLCVNVLSCWIPGPIILLLSSCFVLFHV